LFNILATLLRGKKLYKVKWVQNFSAKLNNDLEGVNRGFRQKIGLGLSWAQTAKKVVTLTLPEQRHLYSGKVKVVTVLKHHN
jgi:hypothetical protein